MTRRTIVPIFLNLAFALIPWASLFAQATTPLPRGDARQAGFAPEKLQAIDALIQRAVDERKIAGGSALVARGGRVVHVAVAGMQDAEAAIPLRQDTVFRIASMTKPITTVAAMMLVEEGKLRLDDPIAKFISEFASVRVLTKGATLQQPLSAITNAVATPPTIRHLLTHTSGITYSFWNHPVLAPLYREAGLSAGLIETPFSMAENVRRLAGQPLLFQPGAAWEYGLNTDVLGRVIEVASGLTLDEFFQTRIFRSLNMHDTHFLLPVEKRARLAALYAPDASKNIRRVGDGPQLSVSAIGTVNYSATFPLADKSQFFSGGGGLVSTIDDYTRFLQMLLSGGELDGQRLIKSDAVAQMTRNQIGDLVPAFTNHGDKFGYGFGVVTAASKPAEIATVGSFSWGGIFYTYFLVDPQKDLVLIFMTQVFPWDHLTLHGDFKRLVYAALLP
jgi:CubicO group peptidase (beta-lactamase class C family)